MMGDERRGHPILEGVAVAVLSDLAIGLANWAVAQWRRRRRKQRRARSQKTPTPHAS